jgi:lipopolysaccharide transport LptD-like protein
MRNDNCELRTNCGLRTHFGLRTNYGLRTKYAVRMLLAIAATSSALAVRAGAQVVRPSVRGPALRADTTRSDSTADSSKVKQLIKWAEPDSTMAALLNRSGYTPTKYQGVRVTFDAKKRTLFIEGDPAGVARGVTLLVGDTIIYNDSTKLVLARGDTLVLRDPTQGAADLVALGEMRYNVEAQRGMVTNISTALESGEKWYLGGSTAVFINDTTRGRQTAFYVRNGVITSCDDSIPDYHFQAKEIKLISRNLMVARPAVLYIGDVPVMWLPFIFQDMRSGRRSGILTPRFGLNELFRNSPTYRRHLENLGYYFAFSDYMDFQTSLDWRSGSNTREGDPGWVRLNGEWRYRWLDRFLTGRVAVSHLAQRDGTSNTAYSWGHQQDFSKSSHLTMDINYVTNTTIQRQNSFDPRQVLATIQSQVSYAQKLGPATLSIGGSRRQYPGRAEVTQDFPNFSIATPTVSLGKWLEWTPSLDVRNSEQLKVDQLGEFAFRFFDRNGIRDSTRLRGDSRITNLSLSTPLKLFGFLLSNSIRVTDRENNSPVRIPIIDQNDPTRTNDRVFARTYSTEVDWQTGFSLPPFLSSTFKISPYATMSNVDPHAYYVRTEQTGGRYVHQKKRFSYGASASPALFGFFPGLGSVERFRHSINPVITWSYSPAATVSREYLAALNTNPTTYLGSLPQHQVSLGLAQALEAKLKTKDTSSTSQGKKIKVLSVNFSTLTYDFERKKATGRSGLVNDFFSYDLSSDLLPGFRVGVNYSLFEGNVLSDTARFKPFRTGIDASFSVNGQSGIFAAISRIFGKAVPQPTPQIERLQPSSEDALAQRAAATPVAGSAVANRLYSMPATQGWQASFTFSSSRQRVTKGGQFIEVDPAAVCRALGSGLAYDLCIEQQKANPTSVVPIQGITAGAPIVRQPPHENVQSQMSFHITPKWAASWGTNYDFRAREFGSHSVTLQRELHDWRSVFAFTRSPNGNFAFSFFIALTAQPDIKFDYDRQTYNQSGR